MREYEKTHPWITFSIDLSRAPHTLWMELGECSSKIEHISRVPLVHESARDLYNVYLAKGVQGTTAIEGNTLSEEQVRQYIEGTLELPPSQEYLAQEVENIMTVINGIIEEVKSGKVDPLDSMRVRGMNYAVLDKLEPEDGSVPGEFREHSVLVGGRYRGAPAEDCEYLVDRLCKWLTEDIVAPDGQKFAYAIIRAVMAHLYVAWIHPFGDGNGRTARLLEFDILLQSGVPVPACQLLSSHYNATRVEYARQLDHASRSDGDAVPFLCYAVQGLVDGLRLQLEVVWEQHLDIVWTNYVYDGFRSETPVGKRRRNLILDLSKQKEPVPLEDLTSISGRVADSYAGKTAQTLTRDIRLLINSHWMLRGDAGFVANKYSMLNFFPFRAPQ